MGGFCIYLTIFTYRPCGVTNLYGTRFWRSKTAGYSAINSCYVSKRYTQSSRGKNMGNKILIYLVLAAFVTGLTPTITSAASIKSWGSNASGQASPPAGNNFVAIAAGWYHSLALKSDGSIVGWGSCANPPGGNGFFAIAAGGRHSLALKSDGSIIGWGDNYYGQANPPAGNDFVAIAAGYEHSLALKSDGSIVGWGSNSDDCSGNWYGQASPPAGNDFVAISAGRFHNLALKSDGSIVGWGNNWYGQASTPDGNDFVAIAAGEWHSLALKVVVCVNPPRSDLNGDCKVDFLDLAIMAGEWLNCGLDDQQWCWP